MKHAILLCAALLGLAAPLHAQDSIVMTQLDSAVVLMANEGYRPMNEPVVSSLAEAESEAFKLTLKSGASYIIVGVCDADCSDLDLVLRDADGAELTSDMELDDVPMLAYEATGEMAAVVTVQMATCDGQCSYGVRAFQLGK